MRPGEALRGHLLLTFGPEPSTSAAPCVCLIAETAERARHRSGLAAEPAANLGYAREARNVAAMMEQLRGFEVISTRSRCPPNAEVCSTARFAVIVQADDLLRL